MDASPFLGFCVGAAFSLLGLLFGHALIGKLLSGLPPSARWGISGGVGLGIYGILYFLAGGFAPWVGLAIIALGFRQMRELRPVLPSCWNAWLFIAAILSVFLLRLPSALSPSDSSDWDSISHQMAMAKIWIQHGTVDYIPFMHQSNITPTINMLYMNVLGMGGQYAAKTVMIFFALFGALAIGGMSRFRYGGNAGFWAALALVAIPVVAWEIGTAYIDVAHGMFGGLAIIFAALWLFSQEESKLVWLAAICLGLAIATKYTGLQVAVAVGAASLILGLTAKSTKRALTGIGIMAAVSVVIAAPWYIRNVMNTGNPVYPFFYSVFGGRNWNEANADAYAAEQRSFGIGQRIRDGAYAGKDPSSLPGAVTALALEPDKQINAGTPWGAIGPVFLLGLIWWPLAGFRRFDLSPAQAEKAIVLAVALLLFMWFYLTQQSRYIIALVFPVAFLLSGAVGKLRLGVLPALAVCSQLAWTLFLFAPLDEHGKDQVSFLLAPNEQEFLGKYLPFWEPAQYLNELGRSERVKVALYDEVWGFYLDVPYFWANPGHSTMIRYEKISTAEQLVSSLKSLGTTHVFVNFQFLGEQGANLAKAFFSKDGQGPDLSGVEKFRVLLLEATKRGLLELVAAYGSREAPSSILLRIR